MQKLLKEDFRKYLDCFNVSSFNGLRINTSKISVEDFLKISPFHLTPVPWCSEGFYYSEEDKPSQHPYYHAGLYYLQEPSAMAPGAILPVEPDDVVLDGCRAPGGKTTELATISNNGAHITACEMNKIRIEKLKYNLEMQGASSVFVMPKDARNLDDFLKFDMILLDSPCSGSGTLDVNDEKLNKYFTETLVQKSIKSQRLLINKAIKLLKKGGELVYSTCSILKQENEDIIMEALKNKNIELVPISMDDMEDIPCLKTSLPGVLCVEPTDMYEGFFVAKLKKIS